MILNGLYVKGEKMKVIMKCIERVGLGDTEGGGEREIERKRGRVS